MCDGWRRPGNATDVQAGRLSLKSPLVPPCGKDVVFFNYFQILVFSLYLYTHYLPKILSLSLKMATHSSVLAWRIPGTAEPGGLPSMGSHRVGHDWNDLAAAAVIIIPCEVSCQRRTSIIWYSLYVESNLKKRYRRTYFQSRSWLVDIKNKLRTTKGETLGEE